MVFFRVAFNSSDMIIYSLWPRGCIYGRVDQPDGLRKWVNPKGTLVYGIGGNIPL